MKKVLCFGEALIDFLNTGNEDSDGLKINHFNQFPGGAPANAAVALAKLGAHAAFVGQVGKDMFGDFLKSCLDHYSVDTQYLAQHQTAKTALAFVSLDDEGERTFSFYRQNSADMVFDKSQVDLKMFDSAAILHFCSNTLTDDHITATTLSLIEQAQAKGVLVSFDINLRHNLWAEGHANKALVNQFVAKANVLKFSREEISYLTDDIERYVADILTGQAQLVVITNDGGAIEYFTQSDNGEVKAPKAEVRDTTAGGDAFSGGLLYALSQFENLSESLVNPDQVVSAVEFASRCGAFAVTKPGAFPALPTLKDVQNLS